MRTVVGLYDRFEDAQKAVEDLLKAGFQRENINFVSRDAKGDYTRAVEDSTVIEPEETGDSAVTGAGIGAVLGGMTGLLAGLGALAIPGVGPVIAAGPLIATLTGAGIGAVSGGIIGGLVDLGIPEEHAHYYAEGVRRGGTLVTVQTTDQQVDSALTILNRYRPIDIETRALSWKEKDWSRFDESRDPLDQSEMEYNRPYYQQQSQRTSVDVHPMEETGVNLRQAVPVTGDAADITQHDPDLDYGDIEDQDVEGRQRDRDIPVTGSEATVISGATSEMRDFDRTDWTRYEPMFQEHYQKAYFDRGRDFLFYLPAYRLGYSYASDPQYAGRDWISVEPELRAEWERRGEPDTWEAVKGAIRYTWDSLTR